MGLNEAYTKDVVYAWVWAHRIVAETMSDAGERTREAGGEEKALNSS